MSVPSVPNSGAPERPPARQSSGCVTALMVIAGLVLLLPGLCALVFTGSLQSTDSEMWSLWLVCIVISAGGIALIIKAFR